MTALLAFVCQFLYVALLGLQSRNVQHGNFVGAACVSTCLGISGLTITTVIARAAILGGGWPVWIGFVAAGPIGITTAMWAHDRWGKRK